MVLLDCYIDGVLAATVTDTTNMGSTRLGLAESVVMPLISSAFNWLSSRS